MEKYSVEFKMQIVQEYLNGEEAIDLLITTTTIDTSHQKIGHTFYWLLEPFPGDYTTLYLKMKSLYDEKYNNRGFIQ